MARKEILAIYISKPPLLKTKEGFKNHASISKSVLAYFPVPSASPHCRPDAGRISERCIYFQECIGGLSSTFGFPLPVVLTKVGSRNNAYISMLYWRTFLYLRFPPPCRPDAGRISERCIYFQVVLAYFPEPSVSPSMSS